MVFTTLWFHAEIEVHVHTKKLCIATAISAPDVSLSLFQVKAIHIHSDMFSVQNGLLTPTLKAKRPELRDYFKKQIEELYSSISI